MRELYIMRWPRDLTAVYVKGATIRYEQEQSVYYANEVLTPGQIICTWSSMTNYLSSGCSPSLPLLKTGKTYELRIKLKADNVLPVQIQINFLDGERVVLASYRGTDPSLAFRVPEGTVSYDVHLVNLKHQWLRFEFLTIGEVGSAREIAGAVFGQGYEWVHVCPSRAPKGGRIRIIVNKGPRSILPVSLGEGMDEEGIFIYTNGQAFTSLVQSLDQIRFYREMRYTFEAGLGYYHLPSEFIDQLKEELKQKIRGKKE